MRIDSGIVTCAKKHEPEMAAKGVGSSAAGRNLTMRRTVRGYAYIMPALFLISLGLIAPTIYGFLYSLYDIKYLRTTDFVGLENYAYLVTDPAFAAMITRSFVFAALSVSLAIGIALPIAVWIDHLRGWRALVVQIVVMLPWIVSSIIGALLFQWVFVNDIGWGMYLLSLLGISNFRPLSDPVAAMAVLILFAVWRTLGFSMLLLLAGLKSIPADYHEAAQLDGANAWQRFLHITLPQLQTPLLITLVILTVSDLNNVEGPLIVTAGGPAGTTDVLPLDLYLRAFTQFDFNSAIALGIGMFAANILLAFAYVRLVKHNG